MLWLPNTEIWLTSLNNLNLSFRERSNTSLIYGPARMNTISLVVRPDLTHRKPNCRLTGKQISLKFVWVWELVIRQTLLPSTNKAVLSTPSLLMEHITQPLWVVITGRRWLVLGLPCSSTVTERVLTLLAGGAMVQEIRSG